MTSGAQRLLKPAGQIMVCACPAPEWLGRLPCANLPRGLQLKTAALPPCWGEASGRAGPYGMLTRP
jgi:hypothetical protein